MTFTFILRDLSSRYFLFFSPKFSESKKRSHKSDSKKEESSSCILSFCEESSKESSQESFEEASVVFHAQFKFLKRQLSCVVPLSLSLSLSSRLTLRLRKFFQRIVTNCPRSEFNNTYTHELFFYSFVIIHVCLCMFLRETRDIDQYSNCRLLSFEFVLHTRLDPSCVHCMSGKRAFQL